MNRIKKLFTWKKKKTEKPDTRVVRPAVCYGPMVVSYQPVGDTFAVRVSMN
jgi:hypothetical protein